MPSATTASSEIVSRRVEGDIHRYTYRELAARSRQLAKALAALGVQAGRPRRPRWPGTATATWSCTTASPASGAVLHTHQPAPAPRADRLHRQPRRRPGAVLRPDLPAAGRGASRRAPKTVKALGRDDRPRAHAGRHARSPNLLCYEELLDAAGRPTTTGRSFDENTASSLCYTSGTTGNPKGVLYSHRSTVLHAYAAALPDALNCSARDVILPVVPMFHVNAWGLPYAALHGRRQAGVPRRRAGRQEPVRAVRGREGHAVGRRAHGLAGPAGATWRPTSSSSAPCSAPSIGGSACPPAMITQLPGRATACRCCTPGA